MGTSLAEIRDSGWLELYVLGELAPSERTQLEEALLRFPELKQDLSLIEKALEVYAKANQIPPNPQVLASALTEIKAGDKVPTSSTKKGGSKGLLFGLGGLALLLSALCTYLFVQVQSSGQELDDLREAVEACEETARRNEQPVAMLQDLQRTDNQVVSIQPTDKYPETSILIYNNPNTLRNYLVLADLPQLAPGQAYQLWSLKADADPIPLDVFDDGQAVVPVTFVEGTSSYAITIEAEQGAVSPNLDQLVGVFGLDT